MNDTKRGPLQVGNADFGTQVLESETPVLVDFWAEWCAPCRALGPIIESLAADYGDRIKIAKVDVDSNQEIAMQFGIRSIPTVMLFDKGRVVDAFVGVRPKADYAASLERLAG